MADSQARNEVLLVLAKVVFINGVVSMLTYLVARFGPARSRAGPSSS